MHKTHHNPRPNQIFKNEVQPAPTQPQPSRLPVRKGIQRREAFNNIPTMEFALNVAIASAVRVLIETTILKNKDKDKDKKYT